MDLANHALQRRFTDFLMAAKQANLPGRADLGIVVTALQQVSPLSIDDDGSSELFWGRTAHAAISLAD